eukprot:5538699-Alexandrium_andersonii.AAC.1
MCIRDRARSEAFRCTARPLGAKGGLSAEWRLLAPNNTDNDKWGAPRAVAAERTAAGLLAGSHGGTKSPAQPT